MTSPAPRSSSRFSISALYSRARTCDVSVSGLTSWAGWASTRRAVPVPAAALPTEARYRPCRIATSMPLGSFRESSSLATVPKLAKRPSTRGTSSTRPSPCRAAATAACASSRSSGIVTTMFGRTTPLLRGSSGMKSVFTSAMGNFSFVFSPGTTGRDRLRRLGTIDEPELALVAVVADQRRRLFEEDVDPVVGDVGTVVLAMSLAQPVHQRLPVGLQIEHGIQRALQFGEHRVQGLRLWQGAGEPVKDEAGFGVRLGETVPDDVDDQLVRDQLAAIEVGADALSERRPGLDLRSQDVARGDCRNPVLLRQPGCLGALARAGRSE